MSVGHRLAGGLAAAVGAVSALVPMLMLMLGPSWFSRCSDYQSTSFVFRHLGGLAFSHAFFGAALSALLVLGGAAVYYGRPVGVALLKAFVWLQLAYVALFEIAWLHLLPQFAKRLGSTALATGATLGVVLAGGLAAVFLVLLLRLLDKIQWPESRREDRGGGIRN
jgi:hypothetical protein